jgi:hypothetical protein
MSMIWTVILKNGEKWSFSGPPDTEPTLLLLEDEGTSRDDVAVLVRGDMVNRIVFPPSGAVG